MRQTTFLAVFAIAVLSVCAGTRIPREVYSKGALAQVRIKIVDQDGDVVPDAKIWGGFTCGNFKSDYVLVNGFTDSNGVYVAHGRCNEFLRVDVSKRGYYNSEMKSLASHKIEMSVCSC